MKNVLRITIILIILIEIVFCTSYCYATGIIDNPESYKPNEDDAGVKPLIDKAGVILGIIKTVGIVVSVVALMIIGLKTMTGSVEQKSHYKEVLPGYIIGVVLIAAMTLLPSIIYDITRATPSRTPDPRAEGKPIVTETPEIQ